MSLSVIHRPAAGPTALPIARTVVAIPQFHQHGYAVDALPGVAHVDRNQHLVAFDVRDYPDVLAAVQTHDGAHARSHAGIWTHDLIAYDREDAGDVWTWTLRRFAGVSERARRAAFWREARPLGILERLVSVNVLTDNGALTMEKIIGSASPTGIPFNHLQLSADAKTAQVSTAMSSTGVTAIPVVSGGTNFTNGMSITLGYGSTNAETVTVGSGSTSTSIVCSATTKTHSANDWVVPNPTTSDNPSSVTSGYDSGALTSGAFAYSGAGAGNRQVQVTYNFPANAGAPAGGYTDLWVANAATIAAGTTAAHQTRSPLLVNGSTGVNVVYTDQQ
ncbi:MAG: hypothetical protein IVW57_00130 [Ktedonobacterales bacterium]|nr:hypothetical protein [Ktedonobacterales bacterium]